MAQAFFRTRTLMVQFKKMEGPFRSARRSLVRDGVKALLPSAHSKFTDETQQEAVRQLPVSERLWRPPRISKRKAAVLRKQAKREGVYGTFDPETGKGWDANWDVMLAAASPKGLGRYPALRVPKKAKRTRTREERAKKIEEKMVGMDERMEELQAARIRKKPKMTFELLYKKLNSKVGHQQK